MHTSHPTRESCCSHNQSVQPLSSARRLQGCTSEMASGERMRAVAGERPTTQAMRCHGRLCDDSMLPMCEASAAIPLPRAHGVPLPPSMRGRTWCAGRCSSFRAPGSTLAVAAAARLPSSPRVASERAAASLRGRGCACVARACAGVRTLFARVCAARRSFTWHGMPHPLTKLVDRSCARHVE